MNRLAYRTESAGNNRAFAAKMAAAARIAREREVAAARAAKVNA